MNNCLVTTLKGTVSNPNLPVLESIQQFTLDAITRGGRTLTEEQTYWLNHFFYAVGAIAENQLWNKVAVCLLPIIASGKNDAIKDYRRDSTLGQLSSYLINKVGGLELSSSGTTVAATGVYNAIDASKVGFNAKSHTVFIVKEITDNSDSKQIKFIANYENSKKWKTGINFNVNGDVPMVITTDSTDTQTVALISQSNYYLTIASVGNGKFTLENVGDNVDSVVSNNISAYPAPNAFDETQTLTGWPYVLLNSGYDIKLMLIVNGVLSDSEKEKVVDAIKKLYNAFKTT